MFKFSNLKLYRKFLILAVMAAGICLVSSTRPVAASVCCDNCMTAYNSCIDNCYAQETDPGLGQCLVGCGTTYDVCSRACGHGIPVCIAV
jgi:hypothetical protein